MAAIHPMNLAAILPLACCAATLIAAAVGIVAIQRSSARRTDNLRAQCLRSIGPITARYGLSLARFNGRGDLLQLEFGPTDDPTSDTRLTIWINLHFRDIPNLSAQVWPGPAGPLAESTTIPFSAESELDSVLAQIAAHLPSSVVSSGAT